jgi:catechol-2,3-dioxygenase
MAVKLGNVVIEARDPRGLARFYSELLSVPITYEDGDWVDVGGEDGAVKLSFQHAPGHEPPRWPDPASSMQYHLDIDVDDVEEAEAKALALGATRLPWGSAEEEAKGIREPSDTGFRVYADPAGHPFCLCWG